MENKVSRLSMFIPTDIHKELKKIAVDRNLTITKIVLRLIVEKIRQEREVK